jgi:hypothetical protein
LSIYHLDSRPSADENLGNKKPAMTKYFICTFFLVLFMSVQSKASNSMPGHNHSEIKQAAEMPLNQAPPQSVPEMPEEKGHGHHTSMDETPHIHHFHKHRVKKLKKHKHYWVAGKLFLAMIQLVLLFMAYMHVVS